MTDSPLPPDSDLTAAEAEELLLMCGHAPGHEPLSPAAQAVLDAANRAYDQAATVTQGTAAALRAAAVYCTRERRILMTIADELEGQ